MFTIFFRTIKDRKLTILIYCLAVIGFLWMYISLFPSISQSFDQLKGYLNTFPKGFMDAFGIDAESFTTFEGFIGSEQFTFIWPIMLVLLTISFSAGAIAGEIEKNTVELLLSQPISRLKIFTAKYLAGTFALATFVFISIAAIYPLAAAYDITFKSGNFIRFGVLGFAFGFAIYSLSMFFSTIFSEKGRANFAPAGILILMYVANILAGLKENLKNLKFTSFFYYYNPSKILVHGQIDKWSWVVFFGVGIFFTVLSAIWFSKRDIAV